MRTAPVISTARGSRQEAFGPVEWGLLAGIALMWGSSFIFIAEALDAMRPGLIAFLRIALGAVAVSFAPAARKPIERADRKRVVLLGLTWMAIPLLLFPIAQTWIASSLAGMINEAMPLFAALVAAILLRRAPRGRQIAGLVLGFSGVVLLALPAVRGAAFQALGAGLALAATVLYGLAANLAVPLQQKYGALPVVFRAQVVAAVALIPAAAVSLPGSRFDLTSAGSLLLLGVFGSGIAFVAMATLVGRAGATRGAVAIYFVPVVAILLGVLVRDELVQRIQLIGMALVLLGAWLTSRREA